MKKGDHVTFRGREYIFVFETTNHYVFDDAGFNNDKGTHAIRKDLINDTINT